MYCPTCQKQYDGGAFCASDGTALVEAPGRGWVGQVIAERYRVERLLGEGGMGQVFAARHLNINKRFAIKLLKPEVVGSPQSVQRFRQEAWAASSIGHENIVEIDDFATLADGSVYLAMEFLEGVTIADRLRDGPAIALEEGVAVMLAVARGLGAAHDKGIIHRDMKPENVFLAKKGSRQVAKILDFGIAKMSGADEPSNLTRTGAIFGTPLYMSPEQARGKKADARSDVYSLGVILYELATGSVPFGGESPVEILNQHIAAAPIPPRELAPERNIPAPLEALVLRALAKEPGDRFQTMAEVAAQLEAVAQLLPPFSATLSGSHTRASTSQPPSTSTPPSGARAPSGAGPVAARPSNAMRSAGAVATPAQRDPSGAMRLSRPPTDPPPTGAQGARATAEGARATADDMLAPPRKSRTPIVAAVLVLLALAGAGTGYGVWQRQRDRRLAEEKARAPAAPKAAEEAPKPAVVEKPAREVIIDSLPTGAKIVRDGKVVAETPEALHVTAPLAIVLQKEGFADKAITVDADATRKLVVKLERVKPAATAQAKLPKPPAIAEAKPEAKADPKAEAKAEPKAEPKPPAKLEPKPEAKAEAKAKPRPVDPYEIIGGPATHKKVKDELVERIEKQAAAAIPGGKRVGPYYDGVAAAPNGHTDWYIELDGSKCYTFIGEGGDGVTGLFLFLWGPAGHRLRDAREHSPHAEMIFCTAVPGLYHLQAKSALGQGGYKVAVYTR